jgi:hypothetical protein
MIVEITQTELGFAYIVAAVRQMTAGARNYRPRYGASTDVDVALSCHAIGAAGELAVAKALNQYWSGINDRAPADVGLSIQVRTVTADNRRLIVHPTDADDQPFVSVLAMGGARFTIRGFMYGRVAKCDAYWTAPNGNGRPAYFVPTAHLTPIERLTLPPMSAVVALTAPTLDDCEVF